MNHFHDNLKPLRWGLVLTLITLVYGFGLGAAFGAFEESIKGSILTDAEAVLPTNYGGDEAKMEATIGKSWTYWKRAHLHANGLGATGLGLILLLSFLGGSVRFRAITAFLIGLGSLGYAMYWMFAGMRAPGMGSTGAAKDSLEWLAVPSSGMAMIGLVCTLGLTVKCACSAGRGA